MDIIKSWGLKMLGAVVMPRNWLFCRWVGLRFDPTFRFRGLPWVRIAGKGSMILIGNHFTANSKIRYNSFGIIQPTTIRTVRPGARIVIGDHVGVSGSTISAANSITIGNHVLIGSGCAIIDQDAHPIDPVDRHNDVGEIKTAPVIIEDDVFVGARVIVLKGVTIGRGSVIGAGAVVTKSIPPYSIAVGNPARVIGDSRRDRR